MTIRRRVVSIILILTIAFLGFANDLTETIPEQNSAEDRDIYTEPKEQKEDYKNKEDKKSLEKKVEEPVKSDAEQALYDSNKDLSENEETAIWGAVGMLSSCLMGGVAPTLILSATEPTMICLAPIYSCVTIPIATVLTAVAISFIKVPLKENEKYLNGNDTYKNVYRENYLKQGKSKRIKYTLYGGILVNFINLILAILNIWLIFLYFDLYSKTNT